MDFIASITAILIFSMACNLDTVLLSMGYAARGLRVSCRGCLILAAVTTAVTWFSLELGRLAAGFFIPGFSGMMGGLVLLAIGAWFLLDWLRRPAAQEETPPAHPGSWAWVSLAAALAVNNAGAGVAAGVSGLNPVWSAVCNFVVTLLFIPLGGWLGRGAPGRLLGRYAIPLSGLLLVLLGACEAFL